MVRASSTRWTPSKVETLWVRDEDIRNAAFDFLQSRMSEHPDGLVTWADLLNGFHLGGQRIPLVSAQGIFKPASMDLPLTIATSPAKKGRERPYHDSLTPNGMLDYCYRGTDPQHRDNVGLRRVMEQMLPLAYLHGIVPGLYAAVFPAYIVGDDPKRLRFTVNLEGRQLWPAGVSEGAGMGAGAELLSDSGPGWETDKRYSTALVIRRLHQASFRERVLEAYREHCAICRLRHRGLLDAAHILPDQEAVAASVDNGLALCKLHHAAFDLNILGIRPDFTVEIRRDTLEEVDGPMLVHGLQGFHETKLVLPRSAGDRPRKEYLEARYERFRRAG